MDDDVLQFSFDVYSFDGEQWSLASSFSMTQKDEALRLAQRMYARPQIKGVRIVQETFDRELGGSARKPLLNRIKGDATAMDRTITSRALRATLAEA